MKIKNLKSLLLMLVMLCMSIGASAYSFEVDGIYYNILSSADKTCAVTNKDGNYNSYSGKVVIPSSVTYNSVVYSVTSIGSNAFKRCTALTSITIPNSVISIYSDAFSNCTSLSSITIPNSVTVIASGAFDGCTNLPVIDNIRYADTYLVEAIDKSLSSYNIKEGTRIIGYGAFSNCTSLSSITIPNSVTIIQRSAFSGCTNLPVIDNIRYADTYLVEAIDKSLSSYNIKEGTRFIGSCAFFECSGLTSVTIPNSVTNIGDLAFHACSGLTSVAIPNSVTSIGSSAFQNCFGLTSMTIPNSITSIPSFAFYKCSGITSVTIPNSVTTIGNEAFYGCSSLSSVDIPNSVTEISVYAFQRCSGLISATISNSLRTIWNGIFMDCSSLKSVIIPNSVTNICKSAFENCTGLDSVTIGNSVSSIADDAFSDCTNVKSLRYANGTTKLLKTGLTSITSVTIPNSVTSREEGLFEGCNNLSSVKLSLTDEQDFVNYLSRNDIFDIFLSGTTLAVHSISINDVEQNSIVIPESVTSIPDYAFSNCYNSITSVFIPASVTSIGHDAFTYTTGITSVTCEAITPPSLNNRVFESPGQATLYVPKGSLDAYKSADQWKSFNNILAIPVPTISIEFDLSEISLYEGEEKQLSIITNPQDATNESYTWSTSNSDVVTVSPTGMISAIHAGEANITAEAADGSGATATCKVTVLPVIAKSIILSESAVELTSGDTLQLTAIITPENASDKTVTWSTDNESIVAVNDSGMVTAMEPGTATITATTNDGSNLSASCIITVIGRSTGLTATSMQPVIVSITTLDGKNIKTLRSGINIIRYADGTIRKVIR